MIIKKKKKIKKPCSGKPLSNFRKYKVRRVATLEKGLEEKKANGTLEDRFSRTLAE